MEYDKAPEGRHNGPFVFAKSHPFGLQYKRTTEFNPERDATEVVGLHRRNLQELRNDCGRHWWHGKPCPHFVSSFAQNLSRKGRAIAKGKFIEMGR
jgi:hypothetical protein